MKILVVALNSKFRVAKCCSSGNKVISILDKQILVKFAEPSLFEFSEFKKVKTHSNLSVGLKNTVRHPVATAKSMWDPGGCCAVFKTGHFTRVCPIGKYHRNFMPLIVHNTRFSLHLSSFLNFFNKFISNANHNHFFWSQFYVKTYGVPFRAGFM